MTKKLDLMQKGHKNIVRVAVPLALPYMLDYVVLEEDVPLGAFVSVQVGHQKTEGIVMEKPSSTPYDTLKEATVLPLAPLSATTLLFCKWVIKYTCAVPGGIVRALFVQGRVPEDVAPDKMLVWEQKYPQKETEARSKVMQVLKKKPLWKTISELSKFSGVSDAVVRTLVSQGVLSWVEKDVTHHLEMRTLSKLTEDQAKAAAKIAAALHQQKFETFVLDGITGSGKTEVYFDSVARALEADNSAQVLILVPEIALTPQVIKRFADRFGFEPVAWHAQVRDKARKRAWHMVHSGKARVVIGARSALFLPFKHLSFVVVDEEHDDSYKQEENFRYHGRNMAISLASHWCCPVLLASATPSAETYYNAQQQKYTWLHLSSRYGEAVLPSVNLVDMRKHNLKKEGGWISKPIIENIEKRLSLGEQSLVFLNRRGMAPLLICGACGHRACCPSCDATLTVHHTHLICHHCGFNEEIPSICPACEQEALRTFGPGTRAVKSQLEKIFPKARIAVADSDAFNAENTMQDLFERVEQNQVDILIGTQMVAKGHHFPNLTFVGVVDGDMGLMTGELRASERAFQLLTQVAGRAGRVKKPGSVLIQTHEPEHPLFHHLIALDKDGFMQYELSQRKVWGDPPYTRQIAFILSGKNEKDVALSAQSLRRSFKDDLFPQVALSGPVPAPLAKLRGLYRYRLLLKGEGSLHKIVHTWLSETRISKKVRLVIDVDPVSFY